MPPLDLPVFSTRRPHELPDAAVFIVTAVLVAGFGRGSIGVLDYGRHIIAIMPMLSFLLLRVKPDSLMHRNASAIYTDAAKVGKQIRKQHWWTGLAGTKCGSCRTSLSLPAKTHQNTMAV